MSSTHKQHQYNLVLEQYILLQNKSIFQVGIHMLPRYIALARYKRLDLEALHDLGHRDIIR